MADDFSLASLDEDFDGIEIDDDLLSSGDPEAIEAALEGRKLDDKSDEDEQDDEVESEIDEKAEDKSEEKTDESESKENATEEKTPSEVELAQQKAEEAETSTIQDELDEKESGDKKLDTEKLSKFVVSKDGTQKIPYAVLEGTRQDLHEARNTIAKLTKAHQQELAKANRASELLRSQLQRHDLQPEDIPDDFQISDELLSEIDKLDTSGALGKVVRQIKWANDELKSQLETQTESSATPNTATNDDVQAAIQRNSTLSNWLSSDPDRAQMANILDRQLRDTPEFHDKPLDELFAEIVKRTQEAFGDVEPTTEELLTDNKSDDKDNKSKVDVDAKAKEKLKQAATAQVPTSLTDIGRSPETEKTLAERLEDLTPDDIANEMASMSDKQIEEYLAKVG